MSVQFGRWNFDGKPVEPNYLQKVNTVLARYGPDGASSYLKGNISVVYHAFHSTRESRRESQPHVAASGAVIAWDGRLDNREELIRESSDVLTNTSTDVAIVEATYERCGAHCFAKLVGDWALSIWDPHTRSLILAKDPIGTRHLYYSFDDSQATWSTILDPLVLLAGKTFALCEEYIAGWFSYFPAAHLTPYFGIHSVSPSSYVLLRPGRRNVSKYWDFDPDKRLRYRTDAEYEEHFRAVLGDAVRRRLRSDGPILAELSGGMDSSSIVCMADTIIAHGEAETPRLDTVSYYNDSEPNWNERPYFTKVEEKRGRTGCHIDTGGMEPFNFELHSEEFAATPASSRSNGNEVCRQLASCMASHGNRVVLSGVGGDEVMGGVPSPSPEIEDLMARAHFNDLAHKLKLWALKKRKPWFYLLAEAAKAFLPPALVGIPKHKISASWLNPDFVKRNRVALQGYERRLKFLGPLPSFQGNMSALGALQRQLGCDALRGNPPYEKRYPYLDRDLLEFVYAVPREQLVRPAQRRSLMRRALTGIVPDDVLNRKRKAYVAKAPLVSISKEWANLARLTQYMVSASIGIVDADKFLEALNSARHGEGMAVVRLMRTLAVEIWLTTLADRRLLQYQTGGRRGISDYSLNENIHSSSTNSSSTKRSFQLKSTLQLERR